MEKLYITGDIHGNFKPLVFYLRTKKEQKNELNDIWNVIVCGDIGMGFERPNYYKDTFSRLNKKLVEENICLFFLRGNHDNPVYFTEETPLDIEFSNIRFLKDYEIIRLCGYNILPVGGATSIDQAFRRENVSWWKDEKVQVFSQEEIRKLKDVDIVCTHCAPQFVNPQFDYGYNDGVNEVMLLSKHDRIILMSLYFELIKNNDLKWWFYGHYHDHYETNVPMELSDIEKRELESGFIIEEDTDVKKEGHCRFIGLDMLEGVNKKIDLFKVC